MANGMSDYLENAILNLTLKGTAWTAPSSIYLALFTTDPTDAKTGTEVSGGAYARQAIVFNTATTGSTTNNADILFPVATAAWGTITYFALFDAATNGNMLYSGAMTNTKTIAANDQLKVAAGDITVSID